jgi:hypothetical protein
MLFSSLAEAGGGSADNRNRWCSCFDVIGGGASGWSLGGSSEETDHEGCFSSARISSFCAFVVLAVLSPRSVFRRLILVERFWPAVRDRQRWFNGAAKAFLPKCLIVSVIGFIAHTPQDCKIEGVVY